MYHTLACDCNRDGANNEPFVAPWDSTSSSKEGLFTTIEALAGKKYLTNKMENDTRKQFPICGLSRYAINVVNLLKFWPTVYPEKYAHGFCFAVLCCGYTLTDFPISIRLTSLALWQSNDCPSASKATLMNMDKYFMRIHYERLHNHNTAKHNKIVCIFLGIYCMFGVLNCISDALTGLQLILHV